MEGTFVTFFSLIFIYVFVFLFYYFFKEEIVVFWWSSCCCHGEAYLWFVCFFDLFISWLCIFFCCSFCVFFFFLEKKLFFGVSIPMAIILLDDGVQNDD